MPKVYDPILCMMVDKSATRTTDAKGGKYEIYGDVVTLKSATPATVKHETSNGFVQTIGRKKWDELAKKVNDASYPAEVYKMQNEVARVKKIDKNHISIRKLSNDKYEFSNRLGDPLAVYNDKAGTLMMYDSKSALDKAIKIVDAKKLELGTDERQNVRKAIQLLKNAASLVNNVAMDVDNRRLGGVVNNIQNDISILEDML